MELYEQRYPFREASNTPVDLSMEFQSIDIREYLVNTGYPEVMAQFLLMTLQIKPKDRLEASALLESDWFKYVGIYELDHATEALREWLEQFVACAGKEKDYREDNRYKISPALAEMWSNYKNYPEFKSDEKVSCDQGLDGHYEIEGRYRK